ncbi:hypothetical protein KUTeg_001552 [Tegillarca granosa]|uniref:PPM-type phosphatase domain-containing protein n=1 Tax=Tegillarca granosa TaxID=220873 RepID=A0ABQ9FW56_TEGGR|nr:hypothetical protein KUTeg_001552 [Tegillarca granosa]
MDSASLETTTRMDQKNVDSDDNVDSEVDIADSYTEIEGNDQTKEFQGIDVKRSDTPETVIPEIPTGPDISITCEKCKQFINLRVYQDHRNYHNALELLKYNGMERPKSVDLLQKRRKIVLKIIRSSGTADNPVRPIEIQKINDAYEYLKADLEGTYGIYRQVVSGVDANVTGIALNCSPDCALAVGFCSSANERWKSYMEDTRVYQDYFGEDRNKCYVAVFDGHHGRFAAEMAASKLHYLLLNEMKKFDPKVISTDAHNLVDSHDISQYQFERPETKESERIMLYEESMDIIQQIVDLCEDKYDDLVKHGEIHEELKLSNVPTPDKADEKTEEDKKETPRKKKQKPMQTPMSIKMEKALNKAYYLLDILLSYGKDECSRVRWSGCSAATMVIQNFDEKLEKGSWNISPVREKDEDMPSNVKAVLVRGNKAFLITKDHSTKNPKECNRVTKAGGDLSESSKECRVNGILSATRGLGNHGDKKLKECVIVEPHTISVPIDQYAQFIIIATNGVWKIFSPQEAASLLLKLLPSNYIPPPSKISSTLKPLIEESNAKENEQTQMPMQTPRRVSFGSNQQLNIEQTPLAELKKENQLEDDIKSLHSNKSSMTPRSDDGMDQDRSSPVDRFGDESGNEADIETYADFLSIPTNSRLSNYGNFLTREQLYREIAKTMAEHLVQAALLAGSRDNITFKNMKNI